MPYINVRVTQKLSEQEKASLKSRLGDMISVIPGKSETWLMVSFDDNKSIYFRGVKMEKAAYVEVKIAGTAPRENKNTLARLLSELFKSELQIQSESIYITFSEVFDWGWNGELF